MNKILISISIAALMTSCGTNTNTPEPDTQPTEKNSSSEQLKNTGGTKVTHNENTNQPDINTPIEGDTTPRVVGIGGIFFKSDKGKAINEWYSENLGMKMTPYGANFEFRNANRPEEINYLTWGVFPETTEYFAPSKADFMINYRVQNLEGLLRKLRANGVTIVDSVQKETYGDFVHILDADGNKIELWEPIDHILTEFGSETNK